MFVVWVALVVQLLGGIKNEWISRVDRQGTHQFENCDLHHTLVEVCWFIFYHLHGNDLVGLHVLTFHDLAERPLTENV